MFSTPIQFHVQGGGVRVEQGGGDIAKFIMDNSTVF